MSRLAPGANAWLIACAQDAMDEDDAPAASGSKRKGPDQGKLEEAVEREKAKKTKAKQDAAEKASSNQCTAAHH